MKQDEYITKSAAIKAIGHAETIYPSYSKEFFESLRIRNAAIEAVEKIPPEDVAPVIHGKWIFNDDWWEFRCTNCNGAIGNIKKYEYCPYCGARMDLEE